MSEELNLDNKVLSIPKDLNRIESLRVVLELYNWRRAQIIALWDKVIRRSADLKISMCARNLEETDILFAGYYTRYNNLMGRLNDLDKEYTSIIISLSRETFWQKIFGWLSFVRVDKHTNKLIQDFIIKWSTYEPGW